jgi:hypothetical protein
MMVSRDCLAARRCPYCSHDDLHGISTMTQRSERWLIVGACVVVYAVAMGAFVLVTDQPVKGIVVGWLQSTFGAGALAIIAAPPLAFLAWATWRDRRLPPVQFTPPKWPRWVRIVGNTYLTPWASGWLRPLPLSS